MKIKTGDNVKVLSGREKGKTGNVEQILDGSNGQTYVVVKGVNQRKKHIRARQTGDKGQIIEFSAPLHASSVMLIDPKSGKPTRVGYKMEGSDKKRVSKKSGELLS
jgi:large subunit ribosomal protein L24